jgi:hypothetical protein
MSKGLPPIPLAEIEAKLKAREKQGLVVRTADGRWRASDKAMVKWVPPARPRRQRKTRHRRER